MNETQEILATGAQVPTEIGAWRELREYGVALFLLLVLIGALWRFARWGRPWADKIVSTMLANNEKVPALMESLVLQNREILAEIGAQNALLRSQNALLQELLEHHREKGKERAK